MLSSKEIRSRFIQYFQEQGHDFVPSSPVVPQDDPTLLFTNAGMNQFKPIFLGHTAPKVLRAVNSQKCIRAGGKHNDLEEVGKDGYHHTFFEMLGNWSFGDYYKKEAIRWAWELLTGVYGLPKEKLHASVHTSDAEAFELWKSETDIDPSHISYHGDKDNFWEMGDTGPCGPCSEIHFDRGADSCEKQGQTGHVCAVNGDCSRYIELWNLVFIQFNRDSSGELHPLASQYVDTGAGLERICQVLQGVTSNYDTDLFQPIIQKIAQLSGVKYTEETGISHRVISDHIRALCFALADGGFPSNEGRGYVLRRILRRASRHGRLLGFVDSFLWKLVDTVIEVMGDHFTELKGKEDFIKLVIKTEEERFNKTLDLGLTKFNDLAVNAVDGLIKGEDAFVLYDTYGFPFDLTQILAEERGLQIDHEGFRNEMELQRERARSASKFSLAATDEDWIELAEYQDTKFLGYDTLFSESQILSYYLGENGSVGLLLDQTPFYAESGGQVGDTGRIYNKELEISIHSVRKINSKYVHLGTLIKGTISDKAVTAEVDHSSRKATARNHTATHLLHKALRDVLGDQVQQKGSLVNGDNLRFDFAHIKAMTKAEIRKVEDIVNAQILRDLAVQTAVTDVDTAKKMGATALFGEKYGDSVRVVSVGDFSMELCGGTHVQSSGEIGHLRILSEASSAAGIRRIEAVTGMGALKHDQEREDFIESIADAISTSPIKIPERLESLQTRIKTLEEELSRLSAKQVSIAVDALLSTATPLGEISLIVAELDADADMKLYAETLHSKAKQTVACLFAVKADAVTILAVVTKDLTSKYHAGNLIKILSAEFEGKGGGRPDTAQGGGKHPERLCAVMQKVPQILNQ